MSSSISTVGQLVSVIRAQFSSRPEFDPAKKRSASARSANQSDTYSPENLECLIAQRVKNIERDDPNRGRKVFRVFLESILLSHFGEHLINDPKFYQLVDDVQNSLETDQEIRNLVEKAIEHLISSEP
jgi:hypothetical protein